jgi:glycerophosphoryl diester phosphodiesterase
MKTNKIRRRFVGSFLAGILLQACGSNGSRGRDSEPQAGSGGATGTTSPLPISSGPTLHDFLEKIMYIAHRGSAALYPEETGLSYDKSLANNQVLLECDVQTLVDGALGLMHDATVDRTTTASGSVATFTETQWGALDVDANAWHGSNYGDLNPLLFSNWVSRYKGKSILVPEDKDMKSMAGMLLLLKANDVNKDQVLLQCFSVDPLRLGIAAGYQTCFLTSTAAGVSSAKAAGVQFAGVSANAARSDIQAWVASGLSVLMWTVNRRCLRDSHISLGAKGFFSDDPTYLSGTAPLWTTDQFQLETWVPGMLGSSDDSGLSGRGAFLGNGYWGYRQTSYNYMGCLQGYLCPIKSESEPKNYAINLNVRFETALNGDQTRWASVFIGVDDSAFSDAKDNAAGYHILFRKNGEISVYRKAAGTAAVEIAQLTGSPISDGEEVPYKILVTESAVTASRLDASGRELYAVTAKDITSRGAYVQLGRSGLACGFRRLAVS